MSHTTSVSEYNLNAPEEQLDLRRLQQLRKVKAIRVKGKRQTVLADHVLTGVIWHGSPDNKYSTAEFLVHMPDGSDLRIQISKEALQYLVK